MCNHPKHIFWHFQVRPKSWKSHIVSSSSKKEDGVMPVCTYIYITAMPAKVVLSKKEFIFFPPPLGYITKGLLLVRRLVQVKGGLFIRVHNLWGNQVFEQRFIRYDTLDGILLQIVWIRIWMVTVFTIIV